MVKQSIPRKLTQFGCGQMGQVDGTVSRRAHPDSDPVGDRSERLLYWLLFRLIDATQVRAL